MRDLAHEWTDAQLEELERRLSKTYADAFKEMQKKHATFMKEYDREHKAIKKQLDAGEISPEAYKDWLRTQAMTDRWYSESVDYLSKRAMQVDGRAMDVINGTLPSIYAENYNWGAYTIEKGTRIGTLFNLHDKNTVRNLLKEDRSLLPQVKLNQMKDMRWNRQHFQAAITQGILQGESIPNMAKRVQHVMEMDLNSAIRNARTATTAAENMGRLDSYEQAEEMGIEIKKEWLATLDDRTRDSHVMLDGVAIDREETFENGCRFPGDPLGPPEEVYNCRCTLVASISGIDTSDADRSSKLGSMSYEEWKGQKSHV